MIYGNFIVFFKIIAQIEILLRQKLPKSKIARAVGISRSTLYLELARGSICRTLIICHEKTSITTFLISLLKNSCLILQFKNKKNLRKKQRFLLFYIPNPPKGPFTRNSNPE